MHTINNTTLQKEAEKETLENKKQNFHTVTHIWGWVQKFPDWHTKATPNGKCCEGYIVSSVMRLMYQYVLK